MPTLDPYPQQDPGAPNAVRRWWTKQSGLKKILFCAGIVIAAAAAWHFLSPHEDRNREAELGSKVKTSIQQTIDTDQQLARYHLVVSKVDVIHKSGNEYEGLAVVHSPKNVDHNIAVHVTWEGGRIMWRSDPGAFTWAALE